MNNIDILVYGWNSTPDEAIIPISPASQPTNQKKKLSELNFNSISTPIEAELALISISPEECLPGDFSKLLHYNPYPLPDYLKTI